MKVKSTESLDQWLQEAAKDSQLPQVCDQFASDHADFSHFKLTALCLLLQDIQSLAHQCAGQAVVDWNTLERVAEAVEISGNGDRPLLHQVSWLFPFL